MDYWKKDTVKITEIGPIEKKSDTFSLQKITAEILDRKFNNIRQYQATKSINSNNPDRSYDNTELIRQFNVGDVVEILYDIKCNIVSANCTFVNLEIKEMSMAYQDMDQHKDETPF